ncbi:hypothetical protein D9M73_172250 [compost metagenome]
MPELSLGSAGMPKPSEAMFSTGRPLAQRMFSDLCRTSEKSRYGVPDSGVTVAAAREPASSIQVAPWGAMLMAPDRPFWPCLIGSAGSRLKPPNSTGVAVMLSTLRPSWVTGLPSRSR